MVLIAWQFHKKTVRLLDFSHDVIHVRPPDLFVDLQKSFVSRLKSVLFTICVPFSSWIIRKITPVNVLSNYKFDLYQRLEKFKLFTIETTKICSSFALQILDRLDIRKRSNWNQVTRRFSSDSFSLVSRTSPASKW